MTVDFFMFENQANYVKMCCPKIYLTLKSKPWSVRIWTKIQLLWNLDVRHFNITYCEARSILVLSVLNLDSLDVPHFQKGDLLRFHILSDATTSILSIWSLDSDLAIYCGTLSIPSPQTDVLRFYNSINIHQYEVISIDLRSWYSCLHPSSFIHTKIAAVLQFLCQPLSSNVLSLTISVHIFPPQKRSLTQFPRASSTCVYLRSHLLLTSCSTSPRIYTDLDPWQDFKIPISTLFCYKWTVTEL